MRYQQRSIEFLLLWSYFTPSGGTPPSNDDVCSPIELELGASLTFNLTEATNQTGEVHPGTGSGRNYGCNANDGWCNFGVDSDPTHPEPEVQASLWYIIDGPDSGCLTISTDGGGDTQLALWSVEDDDCKNFDGFVEVAANDDKDPSCAYTTHGLRGCAAEIQRVIVVPGMKYYVQLDRSIRIQGVGTITATSCTPSYKQCGDSIIPEFLHFCNSECGAVGPACCGTRGYHPNFQTCCWNGEVVLTGFPCAPPPTPDPTPAPTPDPTKQPTPQPTSQPTPAPTKDRDVWWLTDGWFLK